MFSRFTLYFDAVARCGSIRRASEELNISPSAIDRHILMMEEKLGVQLFERIPQGLTLTAAGEVLVGYVRRWRREYRRACGDIDDLKGLRRGEVTIALVEGLSEFAAIALAEFKASYPGIEHRMQVVSAKDVITTTMDGSAEIGLVFNPPKAHPIRVEKTVVYQLGAVVPVGHALAHREEVGFAECVELGLVLPDASLSLRAIVDSVWARTIGGQVRATIEAGSIGLIKSLIRTGAGIGMLTPIDIAGELETGQFAYIPLQESKVPLSVFSLITGSGRTLSVSASLLVQHLVHRMNLLSTEAHQPVGRDWCEFAVAAE